MPGPRRGRGAVRFGARVRTARALVCGAIALVLAIGIGLSTFVSLYQGRLPERVLAIDPDNPVAADTRAEALMASAGDPTAQPSEAAVAETGALALRSLKSQAVNPRALRMIALTQLLRNDPRKAPAIMRIAGAMTKRDTATNFYLIEDRVAAEDVSGALRYFDRSLRVQPDVATTLFPVLANALSDPVIAHDAVPIFAARPDWARGFFGFTMRQDGGPKAVAEMLAMSGSRTVIPEIQRPALVQRLASTGEFALAMRAYRLFGGEPLARDALRDPGFKAAAKWPPFDWRSVNNDRVAVFAASGAGGIEFNVDGNGAQRVVDQLTHLAPGRYRVTGHAALREGSGLDLSIAALCADARRGKMIGEVAFAGGAKPIADGSVIVPANCPYQTIELRANATRGRAGAFISDIRVTPIA